MWDYDKLFAENNVVMLKNVRDGRIFPSVVSSKEYWGNVGYVDWNNYLNDSLFFYNTCFGFEIQYIVRLDKHGNVAERLFDREKDMPKPMPELETGMFVRVAGYDDSDSLGFIDVENNHIIYQSGGYDCIQDEKYTEGVKGNIIEVYDKSAYCFNGCCSKNHLIWKDSKYKVHS